MKYLNIIVVLLVFVFSSCRDSKIAGSASKQNADEACQVITNFTAAETVAGQPNWELYSISARINDTAKRAFLTKPEIKFYKDGKYVSIMHAENAIVNMENYDIWCEGNCVVDTEKKEHIETSNLHYKSDTKLIVTDEAVKYIQEGRIINGKGLEATPNLENITIRNQKVELEL